MSTQADLILDLMETLRHQGKAFCTVTVVRTADATSAKAGAKAIVDEAGGLHGFVGGGCVQGAVRRAAAEALAVGAPRLIRVKPRDAVTAALDVDGVELHKSSCPSGGTIDLFLEPMQQPPRIVVCGASPVAAALARLIRAMGCRSAVAAPAEALGEMPEADSRIEGYGLDALDLEPRDAVIVATQGKRDREALAAALRTPAAHVAVVGSRRKVAKLSADLAADIPPARLAALHGPAGLDIGAIGPEEIALSILAEVVQCRRRREVAPALICRT